MLDFSEILFLNITVNNFVLYCAKNIKAILNLTTELQFFRYIELSSKSNNKVHTKLIL